MTRELSQNGTRIELCRTSTPASLVQALSVARTSGSSLVVHSWLCQKTMEVLILTITSNIILERSFNAKSLAFVTVIKINSSCI